MNTKTITRSVAWLALAAALAVPVITGTARSTPAGSDVNGRGALSAADGDFDGLLATGGEYDVKDVTHD
ncbi:hypothetical protein [Streptosporangium carneum]|uniref:Uncharacterized protein n=1 Tax=Streptosporangium carneum TaxID=47481 RepID=A0A9W6MBE3_9ACTN|nr:hypothetical protein [Streptosporangium carneum]GLK07720.1 hypothetical protein GCM10017600_11250 [Streptosporangium carneum]